ncbi:MAG: hypothetical protein HY698_16560 [Deltaproteobacteria bacterium]|nr:hypothetical protein [Deltaproteobacteria bacterium]
MVNTPSESVVPHATQGAEVSDETLMAAVQAGQAGALAALCSRHAKPLFNFFYWYTGDGHLSAALLSRIFSGITAQASTFPPAGNFATWIYEMVVKSVEGTQRAAAVAQGGGALQIALGRMVGEQRTVFLLRQLLNMPFAQIANVLGCDEKAVKSRLRYTLTGSTHDGMEVSEDISHWIDAKQKQECVRITSNGLLLDYIYRELDEQQMALVGIHATACKRCVKTTAELLAGKQALEFPPMHEPPADLLHRAVVTAKPEERRPPEAEEAASGGGWIWLVVAAVVLSIIVGVVLLIR